MAERLGGAWKRHKRWLCALLAALLALAVLFCIWLVAVRGQGGKSQSAKINDLYELAGDPVQQSVSQSFATDEALYALGFVFEVAGEQPTGTLEMTLQNADTGETLATSVGEMGNILPGQYTALGLNAPVPAEEGGHYLVTLTPHYTGAGRLALWRSAAPTLPGEACTQDGRTVPGTLALLATTRQIGGFVTYFYWAVGLALAALVTLAVFVAGGKKPLRLAPAYAGLALALGCIFCAVLPPYAAPDEQFHINQSFSLATRAATYLDGDDWHLSRVPLATTFRRPGDQNPEVQQEKTTVFTWQAVAQGLTAPSRDAFGSYAEYDELQADNSNGLYFVSAAGVLLGFALGLGFVPCLFLGRLFNLAAFVLLSAWAVGRAPRGKALFAAAGLLPMTLHLAASFSRDSLLLGLAFVYTALCLDAAFGPHEKLGVRQWLPILLVGLLLAPAKAVYLPLTALCCLIPAARLGRRPNAKKLVFLALCVLAFVVSAARYSVQGFVAGQAVPAGAETAEAVVSEELDETALAAGTVPASVDNPDSICFSAGYILTHPAETAALVIRSGLENGEHYIKTLVGGTLSYYSLDLSWGWVVALYLLLGYACLGTAQDPPLAGKSRAALALPVLACCGLVVLGCISWTPTYYTTIYGMQGRYFLPMLPAAALALASRKVSRAPVGGGYLAAFAAVDAGVLVNAMLGVIAR